MDSSTITTLVIVVTVVIICTAISQIIAGIKKGGAQKYLYTPAKVMSKAEQILYFRLKDALPDHIVLAQVALSRVVTPRKGQNFLAAFRSISQKSLDFVVCNKDGSVLAAIELDDDSHKRNDRTKADAAKNNALESAGVKLIRWDVRSIPDEGEIKALVLWQLVEKGDSKEKVGKQK